MDGALRWIVCVRAEGRSDVAAQRAARILRTADLGGDVVRWGRQSRSIFVEAIVNAADEDSAYNKMIAGIGFLLDPSWVVQRCSLVP